MQCRSSSSRRCSYLLLNRLNLCKVLHIAVTHSMSLHSFCECRCCYRLFGYTLTVTVIATIPLMLLPLLSTHVRCHYRSHSHAFDALSAMISILLTLSSLCLSSCNIYRCFYTEQSLSFFLLIIVSHFFVLRHSSLVSRYFLRLSSLCRLSSLYLSSLILFLPFLSFINALYPG